MAAVQFYYLWICYVARLCFLEINELHFLSRTWHSAIRQHMDSTGFIESVSDSDEVGASNYASNITLLLCLYFSLFAAFIAWFSLKLNDVIWTSFPLIVHFLFSNSNISLWYLTSNLQCSNFYKDLFSFRHLAMKYAAEGHIFALDRAVWVSKMLTIC